MTPNERAVLILCGNCCIYPIVCYFVIDFIRRTIVTGQWRNFRNRSDTDNDE